MIQTRSGRLAEMSRELEEIRQLNKKNHRQERQMKEEEEKRKKDAEVPKSRSNETAMAAEVTAASQEGIEDEDALNFTVNVHKIMNGVEEMETDKQDEEQEDERSPMKKCPGSSKASSRRGRTGVSCGLWIRYSSEASDSHDPNRRHLRSQVQAHGRRTHHPPHERRV